MKLNGNVLLTRKLVDAFKNLLKNAAPNENSTTDNKQKYLGKFTVYGNALEEIANLIN